LRTKNPPDLDTSLEAYTAAVEAAVEPSSWTARLSSWPVYAAATGAALASGTTAAAGIIYGFAGFPSVTANIPVNGYTSAYVGFDNSIGSLNVGYWAPSLFAVHGYSSSYSSYRRGAVGISSCYCQLNFIVDLPVGGGPPVIHRFNSLQAISAGPTSNPFLFASVGVLAAKCEAPGPGFCAPDTAVVDTQWGPAGVYGFAGFRTPGATTGPTTAPIVTYRYGWIRLKWDADGVTSYPNSITALDWALEDSGAAILAGDTGPAAAVPEPGALSMAVLAAGAAGILAWRKRRAAAAKA
jgi:hypothetical protein